MPSSEDLSDAIKLSSSRARRSGGKNVHRYPMLPSGTARRPSALLYAAAKATRLAAATSLRLMAQWQRAFGESPCAGHGRTTRRCFFLMDISSSVIEPVALENPRDEHREKQDDPYKAFDFVHFLPFTTYLVPRGMIEVCSPTRPTTTPRRSRHVQHLDSASRSPVSGCVLRRRSACFVLRLGSMP